MRVTVKFFSILKEIAGCGERIIHLEDTTTAAGLFEVLAEEYRFEPYRGTIRFARNREYVAGTQPLSDGDEIAFITPVAGG